MEETIIQRFDKLWNDFVSSFRGTLITESQKQELTLPLAKLLLSDAVLTWSSEYSMCGAWLKQLRKDSPKKAALIKEIIEGDMTLVPSDIQPVKGTVAKAAVPIGAAVAGLVISHFLGAGLIVQACSTLAPAAIAYPVTKSIVNGMKQKALDGIIDDYVSQLDKYKKSISSALLAE